MIYSTYNIPVKRLHKVGNSIVVTIDPVHVRRLNIDDWTFFTQEPVEEGILMKLKRLSDINNLENSYHTKQNSGFSNKNKRISKIG